MEDNNNQPEKEENAFEDPANKNETTLSSIPPIDPKKFGAPRIDLSLLTSKVEEARTEIGKYLVGQNEMVDLLLIGLFYWHLTRYHNK